MSPPLEPPRLPRSVIRQIQKIASWIMGISFGSIIGLLILAVLALSVFVRTDTFKQGLRDQIVQVAQKELEANIEYDAAVVQIFRLEPNISFEGVRFQHDETNLDLEIQRVSVSISLFLTIPLLVFRELYISRASIEGLECRLTNIKKLESWIERLKPKDSVVPVAFETTIRNFEFIDIDLDVDLSDPDLPASPFRGEFDFHRLELGLFSNRMTYQGDFEVKDLTLGKTETTYDFKIEVDDGVLRDDLTFFRELRIEHLDNRFSLAGTVRDFQSPRIDLRGQIQTDLEDYLSHLKVEGRLDSAFELKGPLRRLNGSGEGRLDGFRIQEKSLDFAAGQWSLAYPSLELENFEWRDGAARGSLDGLLQFGSEVVADLDVNLDDASLGSFVGLADRDKTNWEGSITGRIGMKGPVYPTFRPNLDLRLKTKDFIIRNKDDRQVLWVEELDLETQAVLDEDGVGEFTTQLQTPTSQWRGLGRWDSKGLDLSWTSEFEEAPFGELFFFKITLAGQMTGSLRGPWSRLVMNVEQDLDVFQLDDQKLTNFKGNLVLEDRILAGRPIQSDQLDFTGGVYFRPGGNQVDFSNLQFESRNLELLNILNFFEATENQPLEPKGLLEAKGIFNGRVSEPDGEGSLILEDFRFKTDRTRGRVLRSNWRFSNEQISLGDVQVFMSPESDPLNGFALFDGEGLREIKFEGQRLRLNDWALLFEMSLPLRAFVELDFHYDRDIRALRSTLRMFDTQFGGVLQPDSFLDLEIIDDDLNIEANFFDREIIATLEANQNRSKRTTKISTQIADLDVVPLIPAIRGSRYQLEIRGGGELTMTQEVDDSSLFFGFFSEEPKFSGVINVEKALIRRSQAILQEIRPFTLELSPGQETPARWQVEKMIIQSEADQLAVSGYYESAEAVRLKFDGGTNLRAVSGFVPGLSRSEGKFSLSGVLSQSGYTGSIELEDGLLTFQEAPLVMRNVDAVVQSENSEMRIQSMTGEFRDGEFNATGQVRWTLSGIPSAQLALQLENTLIELDREVRFRTSGPLRLRIENSEGLLSGDLIIRDAVFNRRFSLSGDFGEAFQFGRSRSRFYQAEQRKSIWDDWKLNVNFTTDEPVVLRNNIADAAADLNLTAQGTIKKPLLRGSVDIVRGRFTYNNQDFTIQSGAVVFNNPQSNVPSYDLRAEADIEDYRVFMTIRGNRESQEIEYSSDPPLPEKDLLALISFGTLPQVTQDTTRSTTFSGIAFMTGRIQDTIEDRLSLGLGIRRFSLFPAFDEETGETELAINVGTDLVRDKLRVNYSSFISAPGGNRVELDYQVVQNFSLVGSWREVISEDEDDFGADLRFRFEFE